MNPCNSAHDVMLFDYEYGTRGDDRPCKLSISYCDDNDSFHGDTDIDTLKLGIEKAIRMTGYFSIVTTLGIFRLKM